MHWTGIAGIVVAASGAAQWVPGKDVSDAAVVSLLVLLILVSEVEPTKRSGFNNDLNKIWKTLAARAPEAQRYCDMRYSRALGT